VHLHGKAGRGSSSTSSAGVKHVCPDGNASGWGGRQWLYFPEPEYRQVRATIRAAVEQTGCEQVIVHGFSNGAAAAAKLYCRRESFGGKVIGYIIDDPVPDHGADGCKPDPALKLRLYWSGALATAVKGWSCAEADWTCEGGQTIGISDYARALGTSAARSVHRTHRPYESPPEYEAWLADVEARGSAREPTVEARGSAREPTVEAHEPRADAGGVP
jgi:hypothetical protein